MALSANAIPVMRGTDTAKYVDLLVANGVTLYAGALTCAVAATGLLTPAADSTTLRFVGIAMGLGGNRQAVVGDGTTTYCRVYYAGFEALLPCAGTVDAGDQFTELYCVDDASVTDVNTLGPVAGLKTEQEDSTHCWVEIRGRATALGA